MNAPTKALELTSSGQAIKYTVTHRPRVTRRLHLELDTDGALVVVAPEGWPSYHVAQVLRQNMALVERFLTTARERQLKPLGYTTGSLHYYLGEQLRLSCSQGSGKTSINAESGQLLISGRKTDHQAISKSLRSWYRCQALKLFKRRLDFWTSTTPWADRKTVSLRLRRMKRTWGTCNRQGTVRLNTHLIKAPPECLDYVITHELCHIQEMNHGPRFYALQEQLYPAWKPVRQHLRNFGHRYTQE